MARVSDIRKLGLNTNKELSQREPLSGKTRSKTGKAVDHQLPSSRVSARDERPNTAGYGVAEPWGNQINIRRMPDPSLHRDFRTTQKSNLTNFGLQPSTISFSAPLPCFSEATAATRQGRADLFRAPRNEYSDMMDDLQRRIEAQRFELIQQKEGIQSALTKDVASLQERCERDQVQICDVYARYRSLLDDSSRHASSPTRSLP